MKFFRIGALVVLLCARYCTACAQSASDYEPAVKSFLEKIGRSQNIRSLGFTANGIRVRAIADDCTVTVDPSTGIVNSWFDDRPGALTRRDPGGGMHIQDKLAAIAVAHDWISGAGIKLPPFDKCVANVQNGASYSYYVKYSDRPNGYAVRTGNSVLVEVNTYTGQVSSMMRVVGYTYEEPVVNITPEQAREKAVARLQAVYNTQVTDATVGDLGYSTPENDEISEVSAPPPSDNKNARLAYVVNLQFTRGAASMVVDAKTGEVMGGGLTKGTVVPAKKTSEPPKIVRTPGQLGSSGPPPSLCIVSAAVVVLGGAYWVLRARKAA
ncbi:MAG TPA: PepSY domain-containing protein [Fimbriimonadaceae bacterium]|nr:PepSY domain-containing protein [Fimbriimonadaceae bacterium]